MKYTKRLIDKKIMQYLSLFSAVCIEGPKWCGKTSSCKNVCKSSFFVGDPENNFSNRKMAKVDVSSILVGDKPRLIDEWQEVPEIWDAVRYTVDENNEVGQFLLTGSSTPNRKGIMHSGAGRIAKIRMRTMSLYEMGLSTGEISLKEILTGKQKNIFSKEDINLDKIINYIIMGGWPSNIGHIDNPNIYIAKEYIKAIFDDKVYNFDGKKRNANKFSLLLRSLARNDCSEVTNNKLIDDIKGIENKTIDTETLNSYIDILDRLFLIENIKPFDVNIRSRVRIKQLEKKRFVDPSITCALLNVDKESLYKDLNTIGFLFESMCIKDLLSYADANDMEVYHYQDYNNNEVDVVIKMEGNKYSFIEIKLGANQIDEAANNLTKIKNKIIEEKKQPPEQLIVLVGVENKSYVREDGVIVVPLTMLKE